MANRGLIENLKDLSKLGMRTVRSDIITFRVTIPTSGNITQPSAEKLREEYDYLLKEVRASCTGAGITNNASSADAQFDDIDEIRFNLKVSGTGENMFSTDVELQGLVDSVTGRSVGGIQFDYDDGSGFLLPAGSDMSIEFKRRATTITTQRVVNVYLVAQLVPKDFFKTCRVV